MPSGHTSGRWGIGIKRADGTVAIEPDPWPEREERAGIFDNLRELVRTVIIDPG